MKLRTPQYWLAELDAHGNPTLIDGAHSNADGCNQAAYLIQAMKLGNPGRAFARAEFIRGHIERTAPVNE